MALFHVIGLRVESDKANDFASLYFSAREAADVGEYDFASCYRRKHWADRVVRIGNDVCKVVSVELNDGVHGWTAIYERKEKASYDRTVHRAVCGRIHQRGSAYEPRLGAAGGPGGCVQLGVNARPSTLGAARRASAEQRLTRRTASGAAVP